VESAYSNIAPANSTPGLPRLSVEQFDVHATPERLDHGVVDAAAHRCHLI
jgi:hypothetical protein